jgi:hypothetical protein
MKPEMKDNCDIYSEEDYILLAYNTMYSNESQLTFQRNISRFKKVDQTKKMRACAHTETA